MSGKCIIGIYLTIEMYSISISETKFSPFLSKIYKSRLLYVSEKILSFNKIPTESCSLNFQKNVTTGNFYEHIIHKLEIVFFRTIPNLAVC